MCKLFDLAGTNKKGTLAVKWDMSTLTPYLPKQCHVMECHRGVDRNKDNNDRKREQLLPQPVSENCSILSYALISFE